MSELPTKYEGGQVSAVDPEEKARALEQIIIHSDLAALSAAERVAYYNSVCESMGLNPFTRPFEYIKLNNKLTLYANRSCAEQLRAIRGVSIVDLTAQEIGDVYIVRATAKDRDGRMDCATGAVPIGSLKGEALANAMMKAETKAKRRVTLSLCGLGWLDETEIETIRDAQVVHVSDTGVIEQPAPKPVPRQGNLTDELYRGQPQANGQRRQADRPPVQQQAGEDYAKMTGQLKAWLESRLPEQIADALQTAEEKVSKWPPENQGAGRAVIESARFEYDGRMNMLSQMREAMLIEDRKGDAADFDVLGKEWQAKMREWPRAWQEHAVVVWNGVLDELEGENGATADPVTELQKEPAIKKTKKQATK